MNEEPNCTYCGKSLGNSYTFSYGFPGIPRVYGCDRKWCKFMTKFRRKRNNYLRPFVKRLHAIVNESNTSNDW